MGDGCQGFRLRWMKILNKAFGEMLYMEDNVRGIMKQKRLKRKRFFFGLEPTR